METKTVRGLNKNKSTMESSSVGIIAEVFEKAVRLACDCLKGLIKIFKNAIGPKAPMSVKEYEQYARKVDRLVENNINLNKTHMTIKELGEKIEIKEYRLLGERKKLKEEIVQLKKQEKNAKSLEKRLLKDLNGENVDDVLSKFNRIRMEMDAYERLVDNAENAKEMLDEDVMEYMENIKENTLSEDRNKKQERMFEK